MPRLITPQTRFCGSHCKNIFRSILCTYDEGKITPKNFILFLENKFRIVTNVWWNILRAMMIMKNISWFNVVNNAIYISKLWHWVECIEINQRRSNVEMCEMKNFYSFAIKLFHFFIFYFHFYTFTFCFCLSS